MVDASGYGIRDENVTPRKNHKGAEWEGSNQCYKFTPYSAECQQMILKIFALELAVSELHDFNEQCGLELPPITAMRWAAVRDTLRVKYKLSR